MTGVRVTALHYKLDLRPETAYKAEAQSSVQLVGFNGELRPDRCTFMPTEHFGSVDEARAKLDPQLHAWRMWVTLTTGGDWLPLRFASADREAWPPPKPGNVVLLSGVAAIGAVGGVATLTLNRSAFPDPPPPFRADECTEIGLTLLEAARRASRHVLMFAFAFLTLLESEHGPDGKDRRGSATAALNLAPDLLGSLGKICTDGGTGAEARTFKRGKSRREKRIELTPARAEWVFRVFGELVKRQGQYAAGAVPAEKYHDPMP